MKMSSFRPIAYLYYHIGAITRSNFARTARSVAAVAALCNEKQLRAHSALSRGSRRDCRKRVRWALANKFARPSDSFSLLLLVAYAKAGDGNRTRDLLTTNEVRYRLCHASNTKQLLLKQQQEIYYTVVSVSRREDCSP